jgi:hypothetical protein
MAIAKKAIANTASEQRRAVKGMRFFLAQVNRRTEAK